MARKLTIHNNLETSNTDWKSINKYNSTVIQQINDPTGGVAKKLLTGIPSPFARIHLFDTAFDMINNCDEGIDGKSVYHKLVSDCLDLFEIFFNIDQLKAANYSLKIETWDKSIHLSSLMKSNNAGNRLLADTLNLFLDQDFPELKKLYFITLNEQIIGGTSPLTIFFTAPEINCQIVNPYTGENYFTVIRSLNERNQAFQMYFHLFFSSNRFTLQQHCMNIYNYIERCYSDLSATQNSFLSTIQSARNNTDSETFRNNYQNIFDSKGLQIEVLGIPILQNTQPIMPSLDEISSEGQGSTILLKPAKLPAYLQGKYPAVYADKKYSGLKEDEDLNKRILPDRKLKYPYLAVDDFLENNLIRLDYPVNAGRFLIPADMADADKAILLPVKNRYFDFFTIEDLQESLSIEKKNSNSMKLLNEGYRVKLTLPTSSGPVVLTKDYFVGDKVSQAGKVVDAEVYFGFFPFFKVLEQNKFNDYYKVMFSDASIENKNDIYSIKFFGENNTVIPEDSDAVINVKKTIRRKKQEGLLSTIYYEIKRPFDYMQVVATDNSCSGIIIPLWKELHLGPKKYQYAVDFGTTNTHIAYSEITAKQDSPYLSFETGEHDLQVVLYNKPNGDENINQVQKYEEDAQNLKTRTFINKQKREFLPSVLNNPDSIFYRFPFRTALSFEPNSSQNVPVLLGNSNISFIYEQDVIEEEVDGEIITDLKWSLDPDKEKYVTVFLKEIAYLIRNKILLGSGNPSVSRLIWFLPLSMDDNSKASFEMIWKNIFKDIFKTSEESIVKLYESQAPFYYYSQQDKIVERNSLVCIDIGGGSTDVSFFNESRAMLGTSFTFAGNSLWGQTRGQRNIIEKYCSEKIIVEQFNQLGSSIREEIRNNWEHYKKGTERLKSEDFINLYFSHDKVLEFSKSLRNNPSIRFLMLFHFMSIVYYSLKYMKINSLTYPRYICLSGRGTKYLHLIDSSPNKKNLTEVINRLAKRVFQIDKCKISIVQAENEKEITCLGGLDYIKRSINRNGINQVEDETDFRTDVYLGGRDNLKIESTLYKKLTDDEEVMADIKYGVDEFLGLMLWLNSELGFQKLFSMNIHIEIGELFTGITENCVEIIQIGIQKRIAEYGINASANEPLFFIPVEYLIQELARKLLN